MNEIKLFFINMILQRKGWKREHFFNKNENGQCGFPDITRIERLLDEYPLIPVKSVKPTPELV